MFMILVLLALSSLAAQAQTQLIIRETAGLARTNEPVVIKSSDGKSEQTYFVSIGANQTKTVPIASLTAKETLAVTRPDPVGYTVENSFFHADLTKRVVNGQEEDSGTLRALRIKASNTRLLRTQNRMHWAPSFQRVGARAYTSIALWTPVERVKHLAGEGWLTATRAGNMMLYPEIKLQTAYRFYAPVPYFVFEATMTIASPMQMFWLRGQEMTMDDFFTHVIVPDRAGNPRLMTFVERKPILEKEPLPADAWVAFVNLEKGYGFGAVPLAYSATTEVNPHLSIDDGANNGKYWDRHIISRQATPLKPGDKFVERTAFVVFQLKPGGPAAEFLFWRDRLLKPLQVEVVR